MDMVSLALISVALLWYWFDSLRALEVARNCGKRSCLDANVQFLDDTVAKVAQSLARDGSGRRALRRTYRFEFSETGNSRLEGRIVLLGDKVESVTMEPYRILE